MSTRSTRSSCFRDSSELSENSERSAVSFGTVEFHEHAIVLGDNPSTSSGPSIEIDWTPLQNVILEVEEYESHRLPRRSKQQLIMPNQMRTDLLLDSGYSLREIRETTANRRTLMQKSKGSKNLMGKLVDKVSPLARGRGFSK